MSGWETTVNTGNPQYDQMTIDQYRQQVASQGMTLQIQPIPTGGFHVRAVPAQQGGQWGGPPSFGAQAQQGFGAPAAAMAGGAAMPVAEAPAAAGALTNERVTYLRKVYAYLSSAAFLAIASGYAILELTPTATYVYQKKKFVLPEIVVLMHNQHEYFFAAFAVLVLATIIAGAVSKIRVVNAIALFAVAIIMGLELAPMVMFAQIEASFGDTISTAPVRDAFLLVGAIFAGITGYVFATKKDFRFLGAFLSMGFVVVFVACILAFVIGSNIFTLAVCSAGALLAGLFLLFQTSMILKGDMDDPVGDALIFLVQLRNLFMFLLHMLSNR